MIVSSEVCAIRPIDGASVRRICSGQVVVDLPSAVKELVENALDANATIIEIKLKNYGIDSIEVSDNGDGISPRDYAGVAMKHYTSKLHSFSDLSSVTSFGFRGEALNALCELSGGFSVLTKQRGQDLAAALSFHRDGRLEEAAPASRGVGTTVTVTELFEVLPVRRSEFIRNAKRQYLKLLKLIQSYAVVSVGVKISLILLEKNSRTAVLETQANSTMADNVGLVFGVKFLNTLTPISFDVKCVAVDDRKVYEKLHLRSSNSQSSISNDIGDSVSGNIPTVEFSSNDGLDEDIESITIGTTASVVGLVSKAGIGVGRSDNDRQFIFCNGRPVDLPRVSKAMNEVWRKYEMKQKPAFFLNIITPPGTFDVNMSPDKREIALTNEQAILDMLKETVDGIYAPSRGTFVQSQPKDMSQSLLSYRSIESESQNSQTSDSTTDENSDECISLRSQLKMQSESTTRSSRSRPSSQNSPSFSSNAPSEILLRNQLVAKLHKFDYCSDEAEFDEEEEKRRISRIRASELEACGIENRALPSISFPSSSEREEVYRTHGKFSEDAVHQLEVSAYETNSFGVSSSSAHRKNYSDTDVLILSTSSDDDFDGPMTTSSTEQEKYVECRESFGRSDSSQASNASSTSIEDGHPAVSGPMTASEGSPKRKTIIEVDNSVEEASEQIQMSKSVWNFDLASIKRDCKKRRLFSHHNWNAGRTYMSASNPRSETTEAETTEVVAREGEEGVRVLKKEDFLSMRILGQFNLGFIVAEYKDDLYILDQHACDEKYNFETLQLNTVIHQQPLIAPVNMDLTCAEELVVAENLDVFTANGFKIDTDVNRPPGSRVRLLAVPYSKGIQFGVEDVRELASMLSGEFEGYADTARADIEIRNEPLAGSKSASVSQDSNSPSISPPSDVAPRSSPKSRLRLPKLVSMFASRACRMSVMIGKALTMNDMVGITRRLSTISQPWNCPHGRPTMRHLVDYRQLWTSRARAFAVENNDV